MSVSSFSAPWPDPNSPILSKLNFGVPVPDVLLWLDCRDTFLGRNMKKQDIAKALSLARDCKHPDAVWLTSMFEGKDVSTETKVREVLLRRENDAYALCLAWCMASNRDDDLSLLHRACDAGNAFACAIFCGQVWTENLEKSLRLGLVSASKFERDGFYVLGECFRFGVGCEINRTLSKENLRVAAELGNVFAVEALTSVQEDSDETRWLWFCQAALRGFPHSFLDSFSEQVKQFFSGSGNSAVVFLIGRALKGKIDLEKKEIFGKWLYFDSLAGPANQAVSFYESQIKSARLAVYTWTLVSTRLNVIKDMRIYIGKLIWDARFEANYKI